jgi:hypothetical protein
VRRAGAHLTRASYLVPFRQVLNSAW